MMLAMDWWWALAMMTHAFVSSEDQRWAVALSGLDLIRAEAFAAADPERLDAVYVHGSRMWRADADLIADYARRDSHVVGADLRLLSCRVLSSSARTVRLDVIDRLGPARVVWADGTSRALPRDEPTRRTLTLVHTRQGWRIAASTDGG